MQQAGYSPEKRSDAPPGALSDRQFRTVLMMHDRSREPRSPKRARYTPHWYPSNIDEINMVREDPKEQWRAECVFMKANDRDVRCAMTEAELEEMIE